MQKIKINKKAVFGFFLWLFFVLVTLDVALGSYAENEPFAGKVFLIVTLLINAIGLGLYIKIRPKLFFFDDFNE